MGFDARTGISLPGTVLLAPADLGHTDTKTAWFDMSGYEGCLITISTGILTGADGSNYVTPALYEHDTTADAGSTAVAAEDTTGSTIAVKNTTAAEIQSACYIGSKRYVGVNLTYTGALITAGVVGVTAYGIKPLNTPDTSAAAVART